MPTGKIWKPLQCAWIESTPVKKLRAPSDKFWMSIELERLNHSECDKLKELPRSFTSWNSCI